MKKPKSPKVGQTSPTHPCPAENLPGGLTPERKFGDGENAAIVSSHNTLSSSGCKSGYGAGTKTALGLDISYADAAVPRHPKSRLILEYYHLLPDTLPNGLPRTQPAMGIAGLVLGGDFHIQAQVSRNTKGELSLDVDENVYDTVLKKYIPLDISLSLTRTIYELSMNAHVAAVALVSAQGARS